MAFIKAQLDDKVKEPEAVPEGEYDLRILKAARKESQKGNMMTEVVIRIEDSDYPNAAPVFHYLVDVTSDTPEQQRAMRNLDLKRFLTAFNIAMQDNGYDDEDLPGATGRVYLDQEEGDDKVVRNRMRLPRLKE